MDESHVHQSAHKPTFEYTPKVVFSYNCSERHKSTLANEIVIEFPFDRTVCTGWLDKNVFLAYLLLSNTLFFNIHKTLPSEHF